MVHRTIILQEEEQILLAVAIGGAPSATEITPIATNKLRVSSSTASASAQNAPAETTVEDTSSTKKCLLTFQEGYQPFPGDDACLLEPEESSPYLDLLSKTLVGVPLGGSYDPTNVGAVLPYNDRKRTYGQDYGPTGYTMIGKRRMNNLRAAIQEVNQKNIEGSIVELGVWRGGAMMFASGIGKESGRMRNIHLFDIFGTVDGYNAQGQGDSKKRDFLSVPLKQVQDAFAYFDLDGPHIHYHVGWFNETIPQWNSQEPIAVLRIDGNFYSSYQDAFYHLYERVPVGGIVIMDDLSAYQPEVSRFWDDFVQDQRIVERPFSIDGFSKWFRKKRQVKIDWSKFRKQAQDATPARS
jgi:O-methyltransferase